MISHLYIIEPLLFLIVIAVYISYFYVVYKFEIRNVKRLFVVLSASLILGTFISILDRKHIFELEFPTAIILPALILLVYEMSILNSLKLFLLVFFEITLFASTLEDHFLSFFKNGLVYEKAALFLAYLIILLLLWILHFAFLRKLDKKVFIPVGKTWIPLLVLSAMTVLMISNYQFLLGNAERVNRVTKAGTILAGVGGIAYTFIYHVLLYFINTSRNYQTNLEVSRSLYEQQRVYFTELLKRDEETRKFRHDYKSQLLIIRSYIEKEEYGKLAVYLSQMETGMTIREGMYSVGDEIADTILNYYLADLPDHTNITIVGNMNNSGVSETDRTIIVSNLLRNAVEELKNVGEGGSFLFECRQYEGELVISSKNSLTEESHTKLVKRGLKESDKGGNHLGLGISNIIDTAKKYEGGYGWRVSKDTFEAEVRLFYRE